MEKEVARVEIVSEWRRSGRGVVEEAIAEWLTTNNGRMLLYECFRLFAEIEELNCDHEVGEDFDGFPVIFHIFDIKVDGLPWTVFFSIIREKSCILMLRPIVSLDDREAMDDQCISRANIWSTHCDRECGSGRRPISFSEYVNLIEKRPQRKNPNRKPKGR